MSDLVESLRETAEDCADDIYALMFREAADRIAELEQPWIPVSERLPLEDGRYLVIFDSGDRWICEFDGVRGFHLSTTTAKSWMPLP